MDIVTATEQYEAWLGQHVTLVEEDLATKHTQMAENAFSFLRATFYHWAILWPEHCPDAAHAPKVLGVGDLHAENFGTWRDEEGRLVWGVNDFDEASSMPYTCDLIRLATSAKLATETIDTVSSRFHDACTEILAGYRAVVEQCHHEGRGSLKPIVLAEDTPWLLEIAQKQLKAPEKFWKKMRTLPEVEQQAIPLEAAFGIARLLPRPATNTEWRRRIAGLGSLGRQRFVALAFSSGAHIAREAKQLAPSAWNWHAANSEPETVHYNEILQCAVRCPDPWVLAFDNWIVRRLAPDCIKIDLSPLDLDNERALFNAMGRETANVHAGSLAAIELVRKDLESKDADWLEKAATAMEAVTLKAFHTWQEHMASKFNR
jgi:hypothetical protein